MHKKIISSFLILFLFTVPVFAAAPKAGDVAPNFSLNTIDGENISLEKLNGKVVLLGMFHICAPCRQQALEFNKVLNQLKNPDFVVLGINTAGDSSKDVQEYLNDFPEPVGFPYLVDPSKSMNKAYIQRDMPTVLIIGRDGKLLARTPWVSADQLIPYLEKLF
jgi:peroxiredoxin